MSLKIKSNLLSSLNLVSTSGQLKKKKFINLARVFIGKDILKEGLLCPH